MTTQPTIPIEQLCLSPFCVHLAFDAWPGEGFIPVFVPKMRMSLEAASFFISNSPGTDPFFHLVKHASGTVLATSTGTAVTSAGLTTVGADDTVQDLVLNTDPAVRKLAATDVLYLAASDDATWAGSTLDTSHDFGVSSITLWFNPIL